MIMWKCEESNCLTTVAPVDKFHPILQVYQQEQQPDKEKKGKERGILIKIMLKVYCSNKSN